MPHQLEMLMLAQILAVIVRELHESGDNLVRVLAAVTATARNIASGGVASGADVGISPRNMLC
jgi:hypothetical protein